MQVMMAKFATNKVTPAVDSIAWVRFASGNVYGEIQHKILVPFFLSMTPPYCTSALREDFFNTFGEFFTERNGTGVHFVGLSLLS